MPVTLEEARKNTQDKLSPFVIDEFRKSNFLMNNLTFDDCVSPQGGGATMTYSYTRLTTQPTAEFREVNHDYTPQEVTKERHSVDLKIFGGSFQIDRACGEFLQAKYSTGKLSEETAQAAVQSIKEGDTAVQLSTGSSLTQRFQAMADSLDEFCTQIADQLADELLHKCIKRTPVGQSVTKADQKAAHTAKQSIPPLHQGGTLKRNWRASAVTAAKNVEIYDSEAEQEFNPPCFFIQPLELGTVPQIMGQEMRTQPFDLQYFPANDEGRNGLYDLAEQLVPILRVLTLPSGQKIRGSNIKYEVQNGNLHLFVNYNVILRPSEETSQMMENLTQDQEVKE